MALVSADGQGRQRVWRVDLRQRNLAPAAPAWPRHGSLPRLGSATNRWCSPT
ncbi:hypothetical protein [Cyanobium sp. ATX-6F1]|uniref:hypothetical protein n=1 Tax=Cyanobium sp. ATX-6F1 TaxID=3137388 RepID=UPI0039BE1C51